MRARTHRTLPRLNRVRDNNHGPLKDTRGPKTSNRPAHNEGIRCRGGTTDRRPDFEDNNGSQEHPLDRKVTVQLSENELEHAGNEQVRSTIPANVFEGLELIGDSRDGSSDDCVVLYYTTVSQINQFCARSDLH